MMSDFKLEHRYYVVKRKHLTPSRDMIIRDLLHKFALPSVEYVVVESDWPNYEHTWKTIERVSEGNYSDPYAEIEQLRARVTELEDFVDVVVGAAESELGADYIDPDTEKTWAKVLGEAKKQEKGHE